MPAVKIPCIQCKDKHVKCDDQRPKCRRCQVKHLPCSRPVKKTVFRHDGTANFAKDQKWVNSEAKHFQLDSHTTSTPAADQAPNSPPHASSDQDGSTSRASLSPTRKPSDRLHRRETSSLSSDHQAHRSSPKTSETSSVPAPSSLWTKEPSSHADSYHSPQGFQNLPPLWDNGVAEPHVLTGPDTLISSPKERQPPECRRFPLEDVQEACLMRYYVEEISHWFDLCDENRHFQMIVPMRARRQPHLLNAIFAVAARHLSRLPQYKTAEGIVYQGQLLQNLNKHTAVEYMLRCIPALREFHDGKDDEWRDSIIATAVILRQLEEIDDENDVDDTGSTSLNFLPVIDAVLSSPASQMQFGRRSLIQASYWMALRQEIYHSFTRSQAPQMILAADYWQGASNANKSVLHTVQVAKWRWGDHSEQEWHRLVSQQEHLERDVLADFQPIMYKPADKSKGEIFPTIWYGSSLEVTSIQQAKIAKSILIAENPSLRNHSASRATWRNVENEVRMLVLELCGIALCHLSSPPALLKAIFGIQLYGDYFTDEYERKAIRGVVERYRDAHAWPSRKLMDMFA